MVKVLGYSTRISERVVGLPLRGFVHSRFASAANLAFGGGFLLSLNASPVSPHHLPVVFAPSPFSFAALSQPAYRAATPQMNYATLPLLPNGMLLAARANTFPFSALRPGMPVLLGGGRLYLDALNCSLDCSMCGQWDPHIAGTGVRDSSLLQLNGERLAALCMRVGTSELPPPAEGEAVLALAERICGRGSGLTPGGDDFLLGWMAAGWLLYGAQENFLRLCRDILEIARRRTHALSQCWLACAADGAVAWAVQRVLLALSEDAPERLERAVEHLLAQGASSGFEVVRGMVYALAQYGKVEL